MICLMQTSESEEGPTDYKSLTHLEKLTQNVGICKRKSKTITQ